MTPCIEWTGRRDKNGYGRSGAVWAHRAAWEQANGRPVPPGLEVMHLCDNPPCVNPDHLMVGTRSENMRQLWERNPNWRKPPPDTCPHGHNDWIYSDKHPRRCRECRRQKERRERAEGRRR